MKELILDQEKILEYLKFLCELSEKLVMKDFVDQYDLKRINREVEKFQSRLEEQHVSEGLTGCLGHTKIKIEETSPTRPSSLVYYIGFFIFFGWLIGIFLARERNKRDSLTRKNQLRDFYDKIYGLILRIDEFKLNE